MSSSVQLDLPDDGGSATDDDRPDTRAGDDCDDHWDWYEIWDRDDRCGFLRASAGEHDDLHRLDSGRSLPRASSATRLTCTPGSAMSVMGRAGIEPATLGLKVDAAGFASSRSSSRRGIVKPNRIG